MTDCTIYAWRHPLSFAKSLDHTWVTNFEVPNVGSTDWSGIPTQISNWFCWGEYHTQSSGALSQGTSDPDVATAISQANVPALTEGADHWAASANSGAIIYYGLDGVCHNVANQVLASTGTATAEPVTVQGANGYALSTYFFGTYGLNTAGWNKIVVDHLPGVQLACDQFLPFMTAAGLTQGEQDQVLKIRAKAQGELADLRKKVVARDYNFYPHLGLIAVEILGELLIFLGVDKFRAVFGEIDIKDAGWLLPEISATR